MKNLLNIIFLFLVSFGLINPTVINAEEIENTQAVTTYSNQDVVTNQNQDIAIDQTQDAAIDQTQDAAIDQTQDAAIDQTQDATVDQTQDAAIDQTQDAAIDQTQDATIDQTQDATIDQTQDATIDQTQDAAIDQTQDVATYNSTRSTDTKYYFNSDGTLREVRKYSNNRLTYVYTYYSGTIKGQNQGNHIKTKYEIKNGSYVYNAYNYQNNTHIMTNSFNYYGTPAYGSHGSHVRNRYDYNSDGTVRSASLWADNHGGALKRYTYYPGAYYRVNQSTKIKNTYYLSGGQYITYADQYKNNTKEKTKRYHYLPYTIYGQHSNRIDYVEYFGSYVQKLKSDPNAYYLINRESGWNPYATNPSSGAYGLCQALPPSKMASAGSDWKTNIETQAKWCDSYVADRYGTWANARAFWDANHWF